MKLTIEKAIYGGAGLARHEGKAIFVPLTLPGEEVEARLTRSKSSFAEAELSSVLAPSPDRIPAPCPYYGACGGCQYQHAAYPAQLALKQSILIETFTRAGLHDLPEITPHSAEPWGYRNRIRLHVDARSSELGYHRRNSNALLPVSECPVAAPILSAAIPALQAAFATHSAGAWCAEVELFVNHDESSLLLSLSERAAATFSAKRRDRAFQSLCESLSATLPSLRGAAILAAPHAKQKNNSAIDLPSAMAEWGQQHLEYSVTSEDTYTVSLGAFFQINRFLLPTLLDLVTADRAGKLAWDLYAGAGLFARRLARSFEQVVAVEGAPVSSGDLRLNLPGRPHRVVRASTHAFLQQLHTATPDLIVLDPPRAGLGPETTPLLARVRAPHITYVSCDPATLARDLRVLRDTGYTITHLDLLDLFPQTFHLETVARLALR